MRQPESALFLARFRVNPLGWGWTDFCTLNHNGLLCLIFTPVTGANSFYQGPLTSKMPYIYKNPKYI
ncbi:hypothetical protein GQ55_9G073500 [Panicum hallii var. hallii]|uniref:Uncharacterized protein n=1 Tax=Panicum hallii var. hallii TaxID=1504633 RepID=A0A2T7C0Q2_9POAL|nr:hypothetical protein GQ55_9G073500 [Panicum hallii var. hallii]